MKISLYKFITTFCLVPVNDWTAIVQRFLNFGIKLWIIHTIWQIVSSRPFYIAGLITLLTVSPDTVAWIFIKIGEIEMMVVAILLSIIMPKVFGTGGGVYSSWSDIWAAGLAALPSGVVEIMNALGVAQLLGMITTTWGVIGTIKIYRAVMQRGGLM